MDKFDPTKPVQTRDGRKARILCSDRRSVHGFSILALVETKFGNDVVDDIISYRPDGTHEINGDHSRHDLVNVWEKQKISLWRHNLRHHIIPVRDDQARFYACNPEIWKKVGEGSITIKD